MANIETTTLATEFKFGNTAANYMAIEVNGVPRLNGTALNWRDEYPSGPWNPAAAAAAPDEVANTYELGQMLTFNIRRTPNGANDTYTGDAILEQVALHVPVDTFGSRAIYTK